MNTSGTRSFMRFVLFLLLILLLPSCTSTSSLPTRGTATVLSPVPTTTARPISTSVVTPTLLTLPLGRVPQNCPLGSILQPIFSDVGPAVGEAPVWAIGFGGPHAVLEIPAYFTYTRYGWTWKLIWRMQDSYTHPITLSGADLHNGNVLWFQIGQQVPSTAPILDPLHAERHAPNAGNWIEWGSYLYIPAAGCYSLEAKWPDGHWRITFAAGRQ